MWVYTRARRYELMTWLPAAHEYTSFHPERIFLQPSQRVEALGFPDWDSLKNIINPADVSSLIPVRATVNGNVVVGWLPRYALAQCYLRGYYGNVVELRHDRQSLYPITFTGVKYGAYSESHPENDANTPVSHSGTAPPVEALWRSQPLCPHCGKSRGDHKIQETEEVAAECDQLHALILKVSAQGGLQQRAMIGVLHVVDTMHSFRYGYVALASPTRLFNTDQSLNIQGPL
jgi:hypothetical protein